VDNKDNQTEKEEIELFFFVSLQNKSQFWY